MKHKGKNNFNCECDIETAERNQLIISWLGIFSAVGFILYSIFGS